MLNTLKLAEQIEKSLPKLFAEMQDEQAAMKLLFAWLQEHPEALEMLKGLPCRHPMPGWEGLLDQVYQIKRVGHPYSVVATDGSQIYPDKHQGVPCYVLNTGVAQFNYGSTSKVSLSSIPEIVTLLEDTMTEDVVNCRRAEREFEVGLQVSKEVMADEPFVFLCDGSLIFWHLEAKGRGLKDRFLKRYLLLLDQYYHARIPLAGYISLPKSKELIGVLRNAGVHKMGPKTSCETLVDTDLVALFLPKNSRTEVFKHHSKLADEYPEHLKPHFLYMHTDLEIARVEIPKWVAEDSALVERVVGILQDQAIKGNGYPVSLAEAHEQAVVKSYEREIFFGMLQKMHLKNGRRMAISQKSLKKRFVSV